MEKTSVTTTGDRSKWPIKKSRLGEEPSDDLSSITTPEERLAMMWELSQQAWLMAVHEMPVYDRKTTPERVLRNQ